MRQILRRNYKGSDHHGAAADHEDHIGKNVDSVNPVDAAAPVLAPEAISTEGLIEDDRISENSNSESHPYDRDRIDETMEGLVETGEQPLEASGDSKGLQSTPDGDVTRTSSASPTGYVPSELDERIVLELPSSMVRPLKFVHGTFQVSALPLLFVYKFP